MRDDFTPTTKEQLARRVAFECSNPGCRRPTSGPHTIENKSVNIGVAAHITAASPGGPRYDTGLLENERRSVANAIWLCQVCAKLIDSDPTLYSAVKLRDWKNTAEARIRKTLETPFPQIDPSSLVPFKAGRDATRDLDALLEAYRVNVLQRVGKVYIFGEASPRELKKVFVDLTINRGYQRPLMSSERRGGIAVDTSLPLPTKSENEGEQPDAREGGPPRIKRAIEPNELLEKEARVIITGAPGCGKTTLLRYLALRVHDEGKQLPIFLELNTLTEDNFKQSNYNLPNLVFDKAVAGFMKLAPPEREKLYDYFLDRLAEGKVALFLDGLDEVYGADFFDSLCQLIRNFINSEYGSSSMVVSTRPNALESRFEGLQEVEIAPFNQGQIEEFVDHYYGASAAKRFVQIFRRYPQVRELMRVPFLLAVIVRLNRTQDTIVEDRLELYRQIVLHLVLTMDKEKSRVLRSHFRVKDPHGWIKLEFLKRLAYERLIVDSVESRDAKQENPGIIFTGSLLLEKAKAFVAEWGAERVDAHHLANDVVATPLLREVGADTYAFAHLTIQEYLAAETLAQQHDCVKNFCRAYFDQRLAEGEVLPMTLGLVSQPDEIYEILERLPESMSFLNLRLRARGLRYATRVGQKPLRKISDRLVEFLTEQITEEIPYRDSVMQSFFGLGSKAVDTIATQLLPLIRIGETVEEPTVNFTGADSERAINVLGQMGGQVAIDSLIRALKSSHQPLALKAAEFLGTLGGEKAVVALIDALSNGRKEIRPGVAEALGISRDARAVNALCLALQDSDVEVQLRAITALERTGGEAASAGLVQALKNGKSNIRYQLVRALGKMEGQSAADSLVQTLDSEDATLRWTASKALGETGAEQAASALMETMRSAESTVRIRAAASLGRLKGAKAFPFQLAAAQSPNNEVRLQIITALGGTGDERALSVLIAALADTDPNVREAASRALGQIGGKIAETALANALNSSQGDCRVAFVSALCEAGGDIARAALIGALRDKDAGIRQKAAVSLGRIGGEDVVAALIEALARPDPEVRSSAILALGSLKAQQSVSRLIDLLRDPSSYVRGCAAEVLGSLRDERAMLPLCASLEDEDLYVRGRAATALGELGCVSNLNALIQATNDETVYVRLRVVNALLQIGNESVVETLSHMLNDWDREVAEAAANALGKIGGTEAVAALDACWSKEFKSMFQEGSWRKVVGEIWAKAEISVERLVGAISDWSVGVSAIDALGRIGTAEVVVPLLENLGSRDTDRVVAVARALGRVDNSALRNGLLEALSHRDSFVRRKAAQFVGYHDNEGSAASKLYVMALLDPDDDVRVQAKEALGEHVFKFECLSVNPNLSPSIS